MNIITAGATLSKIHREKICLSCTIHTVRDAIVTLSVTENALILKSVLTCSPPEFHVFNSNCNQFIRHVRIHLNNKNFIFASPEKQTKIISIKV